MRHLICFLLLAALLTLSACFRERSEAYDYLDKARNAMALRRYDVARDTIFAMRDCEIEGDYFVPASILTQLRRDTIALLERTHAASYSRDLRRSENKEATFPYRSLVSADNVANHIARQFYQEHGVTSIEPALEVSGKPSENQPLMHTRYCLRRELGDCLKDKNRKHNLPTPLLLRNGRTLLRVDCDCSRCEMRIFI